jgi:hypothetical protein
MLVKCIDTLGVAHLHLDHIYHAVNSSDTNRYLIKVDGISQSYMKTRFSAVTVFKVRAKETISSIVLGDLYEVVEYPTDPTCWLIDPYTLADNYLKTRFEAPIDDRVPMGSRPLVIDALEEKFRKILTTRNMPGECICGTTKSACRYHKDT